MTTLLAPLTVDDIMELLPGLTERAVKEILREHKCGLMAQTSRISDSPVSLTVSP